MISVLFCVYVLYGKKFRINIYSISYVVFSIAVVYAAQEGILPDSVIILSYTGLYVFCVFEFGSEYAKALTNCVLTIMIMGILQMICYVPSYYLSGEGADSVLMRLLIHSFCLAALVVLRRIGNLHILSQYILRKSVLLRVIFGITMLFFGMNLYSFKNQHFVGNENYAFLLVFCCMILIMIFQWQKARSEAERKTAELKMQELYSRSFADLIEEMRMRQHDFNSHLNALASIHITASSPEKVKEEQEAYICYLQKSSKFSRLLSARGNPSMIGFLYSKFQEVEKQGINVTFQLDIGELEASVSPYELIEAAAILLDNAAEAIAAQGTADAQIYFLLVETDWEIKLEVWNSSHYIKQAELELFFQKGYSTKGNKRGIGLEKIKRIMDRSNGIVCLENKMRDGRNCIVFQLVIPK